MTASASSHLYSLRRCGASAGFPRQDFRANPIIPGRRRLVAELGNKPRSAAVWIGVTYHADQIIKSANKQVFFLPGEHDVADADNGKAYLERYGKNTKGKGWYSFDHGGVHFIGLINVFEFQPGFKSAGLAKLGDEQLEWLEKDVKGLSASTPIVLMAHLPLWTIYEQWGWGTQDAGRALGYVRRFGSVTVLNGHIHQIIPKVEGNVTFHTADSTAFPQPAPGTAPVPGPMKEVPANELRKYLGIRTVNYVRGKGAPALIDSMLVA